MPARRQVQKVLLFAEALRRFGIVTKANDFVHISHVNIVFAESDSERPPHAAHKNFPLLRPAGMLRVAHHDNFSRSGIRKKNISIRRHREQARPFETCREYVHAKPRRHRRQKAGGRFCAARSIARGIGRERRRQLWLLAVRDLRRCQRRQKKRENQKKNISRTHGGPPRKKVYHFAPYDASARRPFPIAAAINDVLISSQDSASFP